MTQNGDEDDQAPDGALGGVDGFPGYKKIVVSKLCDAASYHHNTNV